MRTGLFLAALLALAPSPALADVTARYAVGGKELVVEVDDGGNSRFEVGGKFTIIRRDGTDYIVIQEKDGPKVFEMAGLVELMKGILPKTPEAAEKEKIAFGAVAGTDPITIAGIAGAVWQMRMLEGPADDRKRYVEIVTSADPRLAPVGQVFGRTADVALEFMANFIPESSLFGGTVREILAKGAPLRVQPVDPAKKEEMLLEFKSLDTAEIDAKHFELPAPVTSIDEIFGSMDALMKPGAGGAIKDLP